MTSATASKAPAPVTPPSAPGRPRSNAVTERILEATLTLLTEVGAEHTTMDAVALRAGVARATVYLRWPRHDDLIFDAVRRAMGRAPISTTGDLEADLRTGATAARAIMASPAFRAVFPALVAGFLRDRGGPDAITFDFVAPGRPALAAEYFALAAENGMRTDLDAELVVDIIIGGIINRLLATGRPPTEAEAQQVADIVLAGIRKAQPRREPDV